MNPILPQGGVTLDHPKKCEGQFYLFFSASNYSGWDFFDFFWSAHMREATCSV
jgi:hypothetical protein